MGEKKTFYTELAYLLGLVLLALGTALMERADFGMSRVVAPAYLLHLKVSRFLPWFSFGIAEYCLQAALLLAMSLLFRRFKPMYLFSFCTALLYGFVLDVWIGLVGCLPGNGLATQFVFFFTGLLLCAVGVSLLFHTYIAPEAYELLVKEITAQLHGNIAVVKTIYDCCSCCVAVGLSFSFFGLGHFEGVKAGTILCALVNGWLIGKFGARLERRFLFRDALPFRKFFT